MHLSSVGLSFISIMRLVICLFRRWRRISSPTIDKKKEKKMNQKGDNLPRKRLKKYFSSISINDNE
jgi:hypothetical protein